MAGETSLSTVREMVLTARVLLMDTIEPYRYLTDQLITGLNIGLLEARRLRPDLFLFTPNATPSYLFTDADVGKAVPIAIDQMYLSALLYYVVGHAQLRDEEDTSDVRAATMLQSFSAQLLTVPSQIGVAG